MIDLIILAAISVRSSVSTPRVSSTPKSSYSNSSTRSSSTSKSTSSAKVGTSKLSSRTPAPKPHTHNGTTYNSSTAQYTNTSGIWIFWWLMYTSDTGKKEVRCYDKDHKRTTCNRDKNSYQKDW